MTSPPSISVRGAADFCELEALTEACWPDAGHVRRYWEAVAESLEARPQAHGAAQKLRYSLSDNSPLPLVPALSHHEVRGRHLWIAERSGALVVLEGGEQELFECLVSGASPRFAAEKCGGWPAVCALVGRLATAGLIEGVQGYCEERTVAPHRFARFHLTGACQLQCPHCYASSGPGGDRSGELQPERWKRLIEEFAALGGDSVVFTGGEPLLYAGCPDLMRHAKQHGLAVYLLTNGLLAPRFAGQIAASADSVQVSIDGPTPELHDRIRGPNTFVKAVEAVNALAERGVSVRIGITAVAGNWEAWRAGYLEFARQFAGKPVSFRLGFGIFHHGRGAGIRDDLDPAITVPVSDELNAAVNGESGPRILRKTSGCGYCEQLVVAPDGSVFPCHLLDKRITHIDAHPLRETLVLLAHMAERCNVSQVHGCSSCDLRHLCGGTCRVLNFEKLGSRFLTACTSADRNRKYGDLVELYSNHNKEKENL